MPLVSSPVHPEELRGRLTHDSYRRGLPVSQVSGILGHSVQAYRRPFSTGYLSILLVNDAVYLELGCSVSQIEERTFDAPNACIHIVS